LSPTTSPGPPVIAPPREPAVTEPKPRRWRVPYIALALAVVLVEAAWIYVLGTLIFRVV
jgi:hypothetical protein